MSVSLNTQIPRISHQTDLNLKSKILQENEILKNQIIEIGKTDPSRASMLSHRVVTWDGSQKALNELRAEGLNVSYFIVPRLLGGMMTSTVNIEFALAKTDFPSDKVEIISFLGSPHIKELSKNYLEQGHGAFLLILFSFKNFGIYYVHNS